VYHLCRRLYCRCYSLCPLEAQDWMGCYRQGMSLTMSSILLTMYQLVTRLIRMTFEAQLLPTLLALAYLIEWSKLIVTCTRFQLTYQPKHPAPSSVPCSNVFKSRRTVSVFCSLSTPESPTGLNSPKTTRSVIISKGSGSGLISGSSWSSLRNEQSQQWS
jgi:hypothetical protein